MKKDEIVIVCAGDRNFIKPMKVMIKSLLMNTKSNIHIFIMMFDWNEEDKKKFDEFVIYNNSLISFIKVRKYDCLKEFSTTKNITIESYFRLFLPEELPKDLTQVIYLDGDLIVEGDIKELWEIPINNNAIMAVPEMFSEAHYVSSPLGLRTYQDLHIPKRNKYFNAGVLKINLDVWRKNNIAEQIITYLIQYKEKVLWHDQDGLNAILWNSWTELPSEWNVMTALFNEVDYNKIDMSEMKAKEIMRYPKIIHFTNSKEKPWRDTCQHPLKERYELYEKYIE